MYGIPNSNAENKKIRIATNKRTPYENENAKNP